MHNAQKYESVIDPREPDYQIIMEEKHNGKPKNKTEAETLQEHRDDISGHARGA